LDERIEALETEVNGEFDMYNVVESGYIDNLGGYHNDSNWGVSPFYPVFEGMQIAYKVYAYSSVSSFTLYDSDYKLVSANPVSGTGLKTGVFTIPSGVSFVRVSSHAKSYSDGAYATVKLDVAAYKSMSNFARQAVSLLPIETRHLAKLALKPTDNIVLYGDSISSTDYPWYKEWMELYCDGITVNNNGASGYNAVSLASDTELNNRIFAYNPSLIIVLIGGNDQGATVGTFGAVNTQPVVAEPSISSAFSGTYFIQAISYIMQKIKAQYYDIITRAGASVPIDTSDPTETASIDALCRPYIAFATSLPRNYGALEVELNVRNKRNAIVECCNKYGVHCIDLTYLTGIDWTREPIKSGTTDKVNSYGIYTMDGLHPNKWGYERMVRAICGEINVVKVSV
jgi:lysophospholipase L1-like esterase